MGCDTEWTLCMNFISQLCLTDWTDFNEQHVATHMKKNKRFLVFYMSKHSLYIVWKSKSYLSVAENEYASDLPPEVVPRLPVTSAQTRSFSKVCTEFAVRTSAMTSRCSHSKFFQLAPSSRRCQSRRSQM